MSKPTLGSLFAGIGGIDLGFERQGFETKWQVEIDPFCRRVLAKNFPNADRSVIDVKCGNSKSLPRVDVLAGGFPCQDISNAGLRVGIGGERSGLWKEQLRITSELRPRYLLVENVAALLRRGMGVVLGDLSDIGYDAQWRVIRANQFGAPHKRERVWIIAYPKSNGLQRRLFQTQAQEFVPQIQTPRHWSSGIFKDFEEFLAKPSIHTMADGFPRRVAELTALGNSVVPQIPEYIAGLILEDMKRPENG